ncbi:MAG: hypothetical protein WA113_11385, partial [Desulfitobacteriaceae bacterium]
KDLLGKIEDDYEKGDLSALLYTKHIEKTTNEIAIINVRVNKIRNDLSKSDIKLDPPEELKAKLKSFLDNWDSQPVKSKKTIIRSFLPRIEVDKQNKCYIAVSLPNNLA